MEPNRTCDDCGAPFIHIKRGRPPRRCPDCRPLSQGEKAEKTAKERPQKDSELAREVAQRARARGEARPVAPVTTRHVDPEQLRAEAEVLRKRRRPR